MKAVPNAFFGVPHADFVGINDNGGWKLLEIDVATSTNLVAARLPVWNAVCARTQTAGRGRFQRSWVSDEGGLWLSAVVPMGEGPGWRALPLAVGLAATQALKEIGVKDLRMRWPNDLLVGKRKLAGILVDQFSPGLAVAGIGVNVTNRPEAADQSLKEQTARLADLIPNPPGLTDLAMMILGRLRVAVERMREGGLAALHGEINLLWGEPREVELDLDGVVRRGVFGGIDPEGKLKLLDGSSGSSSFEPHQVRHLKEIV
jgi:BirA family biotin operon repressor/biotin-[acetyl-CoA-carboxylase] ligase